MENSLGSHATGQENWDEIVAAAKEEGEVSVYTASGRIAKLVDHFEALYPGIKLTVYDLGSVKTIEKRYVNKMQVFLQLMLLQQVIQDR